jgi:hypothetical protein
VEQERTPSEKVLAFARWLVPKQGPTEEQVRWAIWGTIVLGILLLLTIISLLPKVTLLALLKIVAVPLTIGVAVPVINKLQKDRDYAVEEERAQDDALQAYLDEMSQLLTDKERPLRSGLDPGCRTDQSFGGES